MKKTWYYGYWAAGVLTSSIGVTLVKVVTPTLTGGYAKWTIVLGYVLSLAGLLIIVSGIRRSKSKRGES
ncbi:MAG: hypothetical protein N2572_09615 [Syntrophales bacterium]|nr:hypothetical protein [Syntrophales bacterium]